MTDRTSDGKCFCGRLYGLNILSEIDLFTCREPTPYGWDVHVERCRRTTVTGDVPDGDLLAQWSTPDGLQASFVRRPGGDHLLHFESTCDIGIDATLHRVQVHMAEGVPDSMGGVLVAGTVLSYLLILRGEPLLHASAVQVDGRAIGLVGSSGMGKTTVATLLCRAGGRLITDDVLRLSQLDGDGYGCRLGATELRLRNAAAGLADDFDDGASSRLTADARRALSVPLATEDNLPLTALIIPRPRRDLTEVVLEQLDARTAIFSLLGFPRIVGLRDARLLSNQFSQVSDIVKAVPIFIADVPWGPPFAPGLAEDLLRAISSGSAVPYVTSVR